MITVTIQTDNVNDLLRLLGSESAIRHVDLPQVMQKIQQMDLPMDAQPVQQVDFAPTIQPMNQREPELDAKGIPWDGRIHSCGRSINKDGCWRPKRGVDAEKFASVMLELQKGPAESKEAHEQNDSQEAILQCANLTPTIPDTLF